MLDVGAPEGLIFYRVLPDGRAIGVMPQLFGAAIITIGHAENKQSFDHAWMYSEDVGGEVAAVCAAAMWQPERFDEPAGWTRTDYKATRGYRRRPGGDAEREYEAE